MVWYCSSFFFGGCLGLSCILILVSLIVRFVLTHFSNFVFILSFSDCSVVVVEFSIFRIVHLNFCKQGIPSSGFLCSRLVISIANFFLIPLPSASIVIFPANITSFLLKSSYFLVDGEFFCLSIFFYSVNFL